ncbi:MAG: hypothetical protein PHR28_07085 [candidate division Zixibacteria bacterium]|nr:hypothetical protein [candidate division Zixibacteria bacterium]
MKKNVGLWIDHRKALIVAITDKGEEIRLIISKVEKQPGRYDGKRSMTPYDSRRVKADNIRQRKLTGELDVYYDAVIAFLREAESILIFGPGEAKGELKKRLEKDKLGGRIVAIETIDKMTNRQIAAKVRKYFKDKDARQ